MASPGRPRGAVNKITRDVREAALPYAIKGIKQLASIAADTQIAAHDRIAAIKELLDRAFGKVKIAHTVSGSVGTYDLGRLKPEQLDQLETLLIEATPSNAVGASD